MAWKGSGVQFPSAPRKSYDVRVLMLQHTQSDCALGLQSASIDECWNEHFRGRPVAFADDWRLAGHGRTRPPLRRSTVQPQWSRRRTARSDCPRYGWVRYCRTRREGSDFAHQDLAQPLHVVSAYRPQSLKPGMPDKIAACIRLGQFSQPRCSSRSVLDLYR